MWIVCLMFSLEQRLLTFCFHLLKMCISVHLQRHKVSHAGKCLFVLQSMVNSSTTEHHFQKISLEGDSGHVTWIIAQDIYFYKPANRTSKQEQVPGKILVLNCNVREHIAPSVCFTLDVHWLVGQDLFGEVDAQTLVWIVRVSQRDHVLDPEEQWGRGAVGTILRLSAVGPIPHKDLIIPPCWLPLPSGQTVDSVFPFLWWAVGTLLQSQPGHSNLRGTVVLESHCGKVIKV